MFTFLARLAVACMLVLGGSAVQGQAPNQIFPPFQQNEAGSQPDRAGRGLATAAGPYDDAIVDLEVRDTLVYCGMGDGLMILNVSDPAVPEFVSRIYFQEGSVRDLKLRGDYIYLCAGIDENGIFRVIDISDPAAPRVVGSYSRPGARGLDVVDSLAFVANGEEIGGINGMYVLNIRDPEKIALVDSLPTDYELERVHVRGDLAYAVDGDFYTIDISDPSDATLRSQFSPDIDHLPLDLDLRENDSLIYIADLCSIFPAYVSAFSVYNVADPENPSLWGRYPLFGYVADVKIKDNYAFVSNGSCGVQVFDITDPTSPDSIGQYQTPSDWVNSVQSFAGRLAIQGDLLFFADIGPYVTDDTEAYKCYPTVPEPGDPSPGDLIILDISNPTEPTLVSHYTPDSLPTDVDDDTPGGLPASFALHQNYPNPFNPTTTVRFDLPRRSEIVLTVYNLLGQEVSRKVETRSAGHHTLELDLKDQPSGVYLYKLQANDFSETRKMLLLK